MKDKIYQYLPDIFQNVLISIFNFLAYRRRYGPKYNHYLKLFRSHRSLSYEQLLNIQKNRFAEFIKRTYQASNFYTTLYKGLDNIEDINNIALLPILDKETLRENIEHVYTIKEKEGIVSKTGGTTGKSLKVVFTDEDMQERFAMLDNFRSTFGYRLGKKTAWFSGKNLLTSKDVKRKRFWKTDYLYKVRYYSTFHIKDDYLKSYLENLNRFKPQYMIGFPSTILEIAKYGLRHHIDFTANSVKAIFPTAETITNEMREQIESFFKTKLYNQYASSEGAPFIFECLNGNLHLELQSGVFEVLDDTNRPSDSGRLVVTSFTTNGTPLIRYDIGDSIILEKDSTDCGCGNQNPVVKEILGRIDDFIYSPENGKINLGNVSNTLKGTKGIIRFQVVQNKLDSIEIKLMVDSKFSNDSERSFVKNWRDRVGKNMNIQVEYVNDIPNEASGKYRIVKNNIKGSIEQLEKDFAIR